MNEASKTKAHYPLLFSPYLKGRTLDIGAGTDPIIESAEVFDKAQGDAQKIHLYFPIASFDSIFSSHCLEHMVDPVSAIRSWFSLLKSGGYMIVLVPDEDYYEQGHFPSIFNSDHKFTFTISKSKSWSSRSINCLELCANLDGEIVYLAQQLDNYDIKKHSFNRLGILKFRTARQTLRISRVLNIARKLRLLPIDQTSQNSSTLAQICFIIKKN